MDWSILSKEPQYPLLRKQLIYVNHAWVSCPQHYIDSLLLMTQSRHLGLLLCSSDQRHPPLLLGYLCTTCGAKLSSEGWSRCDSGGFASFSMELLYALSP